MADVIFGKTEVDAVSSELILGSMVQMYLKQEAVLLNAVNNFTAPAGADKLKIPRASGFSVLDKAENTAVDAQTITYATDDLELSKHKVIQVLVEKYAMLQSEVEMLSDIAMRVGKDMAYQLDADIIAALEATSAAAPDHRIAYVGATMAAADILAGRKLLKLQNVPVGELYLGINPVEESELLAIDNFVRSDAYGSGSGLQSGILGSLYGVKVVVHNGFTTDRSILWHPSHVAVAIQEQLTYDFDKDLANLATRHSWDMVYGVKTLDSGKRGVTLGSAA